MKLFWSCALAAAAVIGLPYPAGAQNRAFHISDAAEHFSDSMLQPGPAEASASDRVAPARYSLAAGSCDASCAAEPSCGCNDGCDSCGCGHSFCWPCGCSLEDLGDAWKLGDNCCALKCREIAAGGWLAQGFVWNPYYPEDHFNGPMTWNDRANEYQMNEFYGFIGRAAKTEGCGADWGWRVDAMYGTSYRWNTSAGFETHLGNGQFYGLAAPQVYVELAYDDLSVKIGRFFSPVGYYVIGTANNFFPILPYTFQYGEPFTHTGALATYKVDDSLTVGGGITHGWDSSDNTGNPHAGGLATATWAIDEQRTLAYVGVFGPEPNVSNVNTAFNGVGYTSRYLQTLVYTRKFSDNVIAVIQSDYGWQNDAVINRNQGISDAKWYGVNGYLYWNQTCRLQWGLNGEWFRDQGGFRVGSVLPSFGSPNASGLGSDQSTGNFFTRTGYDGSFYRLMFGPKYFFTPNLYGRAAFVADAYDGKANNAGGLRPFDNGTKNHQEVVVLDLIATF